MDSKIPQIVQVLPITQHLVAKPSAKEAHARPDNLHESRHIVASQEIIAEIIHRGPFFLNKMLETPRNQPNKSQKVAKAKLC